MRLQRETPLSAAADHGARWSSTCDGGAGRSPRKCSCCNRFNWELPVIVTTSTHCARHRAHAEFLCKTARCWQPHLSGCPMDAEQNPVPAILEYLRSCKRDGTYERRTHSFVRLSHSCTATRVFASIWEDVGEFDRLAVRVAETRARRRRGGDSVVGGATLVQRRGRDDGNLLGRLQWTSDCGAPPSGTQGNCNHLLDGRPLRGRCALHGRHASCGRRTRVGLVLLRLNVPAARPQYLVGDRWRAMRLSASKRATVLRTLAAAPATRWVLEARIGL